MAAAAVPGDSLYQLPIRFETADGRSLQWQDFGHRPLLVTMFYSHCTSVCPLITARMQQIVKALSPVERSRVQVLMVSFDSERDTPEALRAFRAERHVPDAGWVLARSSANDVRLLAAALGIRYRELADHSFNHTALVSLVDETGVVRARSEGVGPPEEAFLQSLHQLVASQKQNPEG